MKLYFSDQECLAVGFSTPMVNTLRKLAEFVDTQNALEAAQQDIDAAADDIADLVANDVALDGRLDTLETLTARMTGWGAYYHTGSNQSLAATTKVTLTNNAGTTIETQKPADITSFYSAGKITGREGDGIAVGIELTFTPDDGTASNLYIAIDIGGSVGEIYPKDFPITGGASVAHKISYNITAFTLDTWEANGGAVKIESDGPGVVSTVRYVIHRIHKAR